MKTLKSLMLLVVILFTASFVLAEYSSLKEAVNDTTPERNYSLTGNEQLTDDLGQLGGK